MRRREFIVLAGCASLSAGAVGAPESSRGPIFWSMRRGNSRVFLFGFGEAKDDSWLTPRIRQAFDSSMEVWLETAPPEAPPPGQSPGPPKEFETLGREQGRTFFDALEPQVRDRASAYVTELGIDRATIEPLRPWLAYYKINAAFWSKTKQPFEMVNVEQVLGAMAKREGKSVRYEMPSIEAIVRFFASMPDKAQSQYVEWLLDFLDENKNGLTDDSFDWIEGRQVTRSLDRMRSRMPDLYRVMQVQRNEWWAGKIDELLAQPGPRFVGVGKLHTFGPHGIPSLLQQKGIALETLKG